MPSLRQICIYFADKGCNTFALRTHFARVLAKECYTLKLEFIGILCYLVKQVEAYLQNRRQFVVVDDQTSHSLPASSGEPQGSVLSPLLFFQSM